MADSVPCSDEQPSKTASGMPVNPEAIPKPEAMPVPADKRVEASSPVAERFAAVSETVSAAGSGQHATAQRHQSTVGERFVNTKLNIALINDPKNGPRFTLTKREAGLTDQVNAETASTPTTETEDVAAEPATAEPAGNDDTVTSAQALPSDKSGHDTAPAPCDASPKDETEIDRCTAVPTDRPLLHPAPIGVPPAAEPPSKVPIDSSKIFVGRNGTYYDEAWRWMDWRGTYRSWNWPAALTFGHWFAYRRLYKMAGFFLISLIALIIAAVNLVPIVVVGAVAVLLAGLSGLYANILYFQVFRRAVVHVTEKGEGSYRELNDQLAAAGGVDPTAPRIMAGFGLAAIAIVLASTYVVRGGLDLNPWPF